MRTDHTRCFFQPIHCLCEDWLECSKPCSTCWQCRQSILNLHGSRLPWCMQELAEEMEDLHDAADEVLASLHKVMGC